MCCFLLGPVQAVDNVWTAFRGLEPAPAGPKYASSPAPRLRLNFQVSVAAPLLLMDGNQKGAIAKTTLAAKTGFVLLGHFPNSSKGGGAGAVEFRRFWAGKTHHGSGIVSLENVGELEDGARAPPDYSKTDYADAMVPPAPSPLRGACMHLRWSGDHVCVMQKYVCNECGWCWRECTVCERVEPRNGGWGHVCRKRPYDER